MLFEISFVSTKISKILEEAKLPDLRAAASWKKRRIARNLALISLAHTFQWEMSEKRELVPDIWVLWFVKLSTCRVSLYL